MTELKVTADEMDIFFRKMIGERYDRRFKTLEAELDYVKIEMKTGSGHLRPGGYISGPSQMMLADHAAYAAIFTRYGITPMALTSNLDFNFLRPCIGEGITAEARIVKPGRHIVVSEIFIRAIGADKPSGHAMVSYALPVKA